VYWAYGTGYKAVDTGFGVLGFEFWVFGYLDAEDSWWRGDNGGFFSYEVEGVRQVKALR
jgi:hypothetical protein